MKQVSVEEGFAWAQRFAAREWRLLVPVALAFLGLPNLLVDIFLPDAVKVMIQVTTPATSADQGIVLAAFSLTLIVNMFGWLAIVALALVPGISVREALVRAGRRLPALLGATLLWSAVLLFVMVVMALLLVQARLDRAAMQGLMILVILGVATALWTRLLALLPAWLVVRGGGPVEGLRAAWRLSQGVSWRLLGGFAVYTVGSLVVLVALSSAGGAILTLAARGLGAAEAGRVLLAILVRTLGALLSMGLQLLAVAFYRQRAPEAGDVFR